MQDRIGEVLLYLARHGEVDQDAGGKIRGLENSELNDKGKEQADELAKYFSEIPISAIYTDDLERTYQTALPVADEKKIEIGRDPDLRSWDVGSDLEGKSIEAHKAEIAELKAQPFMIPVGGQSWRDYQNQVLTAFDRYTNLAMAMPYAIILVVHGSFLSIIADMLGAAQMRSNYDHTFLDTGGVAAIYLTRNDGLLMKALKGKRKAKDE